MTGNLRSDRLTAIYAVVSRVDASVCYTRRISCVIHELRSRLCKGGYHWEQPAIVDVQVRLETDISTSSAVTETIYFRIDSGNNRCY